MKLKNIIKIYAVCGFMGLLYNSTDIKEKATEVSKKAKNLIYKEGGIYDAIIDGLCEKDRIIRREKGKNFSSADK